MPTLSASAPSPASARAKASVSSRRRRAFHKVGARHAKHDGKVGAGALANRAQHGARHRAAPLEIAAPFVVATVRQRREELVEQISFRCHNLDGVESEFARAQRPSREIGDRSTNLSIRSARAAGAARSERVRGRRDRLDAEVMSRTRSGRRGRAAARCGRRHRARHLRRGATAPCRRFVDETVVASARADARFTAIRR